MHRDNLPIVDHYAVPGEGAAPFMANRRKTADICVSALFTALIAASAFVSFPLPSGVPATLQTMAVALTGYCLGVRRAVLSVAAYILLGTAGAPVFSGYQGGVAVLTGKTGGFIIGFLPLVFFCASAAGYRRRPLRICLGGVGVLLCHLLGVGWFCFLTKTGVPPAVAAVSLPFLPKDLLCVAGAAALSSKMNYLFGRIK